MYVDPGEDDSYDIVRERCSELADCEVKHSIRINRKTPDIIGFRNRNEIIAVEQHVIEYVSRPLPDDYIGLNSRLPPCFRQLLILLEIETVNDLC